MHLKNGKKLYNEREITSFHETERYVNNLNIYNRSKNGTNLWDDLILVNYVRSYKILQLMHKIFQFYESEIIKYLWRHVVIYVTRKNESF